MQRDLTKEFFSYVLPSLFAFAVSGIYSVADGYFIGRSLGDTGLAAITVAFPIAVFIISVGTGIGLAGSVRFTLLRARGESLRQQGCIASALLLMLAIGSVFSFFFYCFNESVLSFLGVHGEISSPCTEYIRLIASGAVFLILGPGLIPFIRNMGSATYAMGTMVSGFVANILLDYLFICRMDLGIVGVALATVCSQAVCLVLSVLFFVRRRYSPRLPALRDIFGFWRSIFKLSLSPIGLIFSPTLVLLLMNKCLLIYGTEQSVAVYGCIGYVLWMVYLLIQAVCDGVQPLMSFYFGRQNTASLLSVKRLSYFTVALIILIAIVFIYTNSRAVGDFFGASGETAADVSDILPYFLVPLPMLAFVRLTGSFFYASGSVRFSYLLVYAEPVLTAFCLALFPAFFGLAGVWASIPTSQFSAFILALSVCCAASKSTEMRMSK